MTRNANRLIFVQTIHVLRVISAMIMATTFHVNAPKEEAVLIAAKFHERYVSWIFSVNFIFYYIYRIDFCVERNRELVSITRFSINFQQLMRKHTHTRSTSNVKQKHDSICNVIEFIEWECKQKQKKKTLINLNRLTAKIVHRRTKQSDVNSLNVFEHLLLWHGRCVQNVVIPKM